jgi:hypothetical protein
MEPLRALVKDGRLTLDEPCDLPDGEVVVLIPLEALLAAASESDDQGMPVIRLEPAPRQWRTTKGPDAAAILDELRSM